MLLGFKKQFAPKILDGSKKFTIRNPRKREPKIGETLHMFSGLRTKFTERITSEHRLTGIQLVDLLITKSNTDLGGYPEVTKSELVLKIRVDSRELEIEEAMEFVKADGFDSVFDFGDYWIKEHGQKTEHFMQGQRRPKMITWHVTASGLTMYHWTDLRF